MTKREARIELILTGLFLVGLYVGLHLVGRGLSVGMAFAIAYLVLIIPSALIFYLLRSRRQRDEWLWRLAMEKRRQREWEQEQRRLSAIKTLEEIRNLDWREFEKFVTTLFQAAGYRAEVGRAQKDEGVDIRLWNADADYGIVECKQLAPDNKITSKELRAFQGAMVKEQASYGFFVTTSEFTEDAKTWAYGLNITLIDYLALAEMMKERSKNYAGSLFQKQG